MKKSILSIFLAAILSVGLFDVALPMKPMKRINVRKRLTDAPTDCFYLILKFGCFDCGEKQLDTKTLINFALSCKLFNRVLKEFYSTYFFRNKKTRPKDLSEVEKRMYKTLSRTGLSKIFRIYFVNNECKVNLKIYDSVRCFEDFIDIHSIVLRHYKRKSESCCKADFLELAKENLLGEAIFGAIKELYKNGNIKGNEHYSSVIDDCFLQAVRRKNHKIINLFFEHDKELIFKITGATIKFLKKFGEAIGESGSRWIIDKIYSEYDKAIADKKFTELLFEYEYSGKKEFGISFEDIVYYALRLVFKRIIKVYSLKMVKKSLETYEKELDQIREKGPMLSHVVSYFVDFYNKDKELAKRIFDKALLWGINDLTFREGFFSPVILKLIKKKDEKMVSWVINRWSNLKFENSYHLYNVFVCLDANIDNKQGAEFLLDIIDLSHKELIDGIGRNLSYYYFCCEPDENTENFDFFADLFFKKYESRAKAGNFMQIEK